MGIVSSDTGYERKWSKPPAPRTVAVSSGTCGRLGPGEGSTEETPPGQPSSVRKDGPSRGLLVISPYLHPHDVTSTRWEGASLAMIPDPIRRREQILGIDPPQRGDVTKFSSKSRTRLARDLAKVRTSTRRITFALTCPGEDPGAEEFQKHFTTLKRRWSRRFPEVSAHWKKEPQKRGALHAHLLIYFEGKDEDKEMLFRQWLCQTWNRLIGKGSVEHLSVHLHAKNWIEVENFESYFSKYIGKCVDADGQEFRGRWWGMVNKSAMPYVEPARQTIPGPVALKVHRWARKLRQRKAEIAVKAACERADVRYSRPRLPNAGSIHLTGPGACDTLCKLQNYAFQRCSDPIRDRPEAVDQPISVKQKLYVLQEPEGDCVNGNSGRASKRFPFTQATVGATRNGLTIQYRLKL